MLVSLPGQKILDCCAGVGDITVTALTMERHVAAFEQNKIMYGTMKDRVTIHWRRNVLEPFLGPVMLPACLMDIKLADHHSVQKGSMSADEALYFINPLMLSPNPPETGVDTWKALAGAAPPGLLSYAKDLEACWTACRFYRVRLYMCLYVL